MPKFRPLLAADNISALFEKRVEHFARLALDKPDSILDVAADVEQDGEGERVEVLLPVKPTKWSQIQAD
jgi:hypothetical protein